jgi:hypothetical protein
MAYYYTIPNERLRMLVMASESIHSLPDEDIQRMVAQISNLNKDGEDAMINTLEDEQRQIAATKRARGITPEMELAQINENMAKVAAIKHDFEMAVLRENEREESEKSNAAAEDILKDIDRQ